MHGHNICDSSNEGSKYVISLRNLKKKNIFDLYSVSIFIWSSKQEAFKSVDKGQQTMIDHNSTLLETCSCGSVE